MRGGAGDAPVPTAPDDPPGVVVPPADPADDPQLAALTLPESPAPVPNLSTDPSSGDGNVDTFEDGAGLAAEEVARLDRLPALVAGLALSAALALSAVVSATSPLSLTPAGEQVRRRARAFARTAAETDAVDDLGAPAVLVRGSYLGVRGGHRRGADRGPRRRHRRTGHAAGGDRPGPVAPRATPAARESCS